MFADVSCFNGGLAALDGQAKAWRAHLVNEGMLEMRERCGKNPIILLSNKIVCLIRQIDCIRAPIPGSSCANLIECQTCQPENQ